jgi:anti-anti-sigma regulatory factor/PAS domain-containing protein
VLPLYSERHRTWEGVVVVQWPRRHEPDEAERLLHALLIHATAEALASERARVRNDALLRRVEEALRESRRQQRTLSVLFDNLPVGLAVLRGDTGEHELVNPAGRDAMGYDPGSEAARSTGLHVFLPGSDQPLPVDDLPPLAALRTGRTQRVELEFGRPDGSRRSFDVIATPLRQPDDPEPRVVLIFNDLTSVRQAERERLLAQEELLRVQAVALAERSTPLIPVRDDVLVMPLIGTIDTERGRQILEVLLHLGGRSRVRAAILDLTGARNLDTAAAAAIIAAARALRLRGVQPVLTGIQPSAAATLAELGVDFSGIVVSSNLQDAIDRVLRHG